MEYYILIAIISMLFFGINAVILKSAKNIDPITLSVISLATALLITAIYWFFFVPTKQINPEGMIFGIASGLVYSLAIVLFIIAISQGKASVVATINALSAVVAVILSITILSEQLTPIKLAGIGLAIIAVILLSI